MKFLYIYPGMKAHKNGFHDQFSKEFSRLYPENCIDVFSTTIDNLTKNIKRQDLIILPHHLIYIADRYDDVQKTSSIILKKHLEKDFYHNILDIILESNKKIVYLSYGLDLHSQPYSHDTMNRIVQKTTMLAWFYEKEPASWETIAPKYRDAWMTDRKLSETNIRSDPHKNWQFYRKNFPVRIELPYALFESNFISARKIWPACVPGISYATRKIATESIKKENIRIAPYQFMDKVYLKLMKHSPQHNNMVKTAFFRLRQNSQRFFVSHSQVSFVCGSGIRYPVFKFFEVPAAHSMMLAYPFSGMDDYGFKDGINTVYTHPEDAGKNLKRLLSKTGSVEKIISNAIKLLEEKHTIKQRLKDLLLCCKLHTEDKLLGAQFIKGNYEILTQ